MYEKEHRASAGYFVASIVVVFLIVCCILMSGCSTVRALSIAANNVVQAAVQDTQKAVEAVNK